MAQDHGFDLVFGPNPRGSRTPAASDSDRDQSASSGSPTTMLPHFLPRASHSASPAPGGSLASSRKYPSAGPGGMAVTSTRAGSVPAARKAWTQPAGQKAKVPAPARST